MKVLFITNTQRRERPYLDPASRYRCFNPAEDMLSLGWVADVTSLSDFKFHMACCYDVFIFHKPGFSRNLEAAVSLLKRYGKQIFADYDDLIFDKRNALDSSVYLTGRLDKKSVLNVFKKNHNALKLFDKVFVSTTPLAEQVKLSHSKADVYVCHNGLNRRWVRIAREIYKRKAVHGQISYFSGTKSHDHDFAFVEDVLADLLREEKGVRLAVVGPLAFNKDKFPARRLTVKSAVPYEELPALISKSWVSIAPLKINTFNNCKSGLKFFEAAVFGVPSVVSPIHDISRFSCEGNSLALSVEDWQKSLDHVFSTEAVRNSQGENALEYAMQYCMSEDQTKKMIDVIRG